ncbi:MAG: heme o synthase [Halanaeroarchaeum sp.]
MTPLDDLDARPARPDATTLIVASTVGTYLLILAGVSNALANASAACSTWPLCGGPWLASTGTLVVVAHRLAAVVVGAILLVTVAQAFTTPTARRERLALGVAVVLYPFEVLLGARTAVSGATPAVATVHLVVAMVIFSVLMAALVWHLDATVPGEEPPGPDRDRDPASSAGTPSSDPVLDPSLATRVRGYVRLTKPYLWWLLSLVALAAMGLAQGGVPPLGTTVATLAGGVLAIGASGTFNNVYERDRDEKMHRTDDRPVVTNVVPPRRAIAFGVALTVASMAVFTVFVNVLAAALGLLAILYYSVVYTMVLKPHTDQNTVIGGGVGAMPALIGWAAITDGVGVPALVLGGVIFLWTPAHFYNLALVYEDDYARAGFPMLPVVRGDRTARRHITLYLGATMLAAIVLGTATSLGTVYGGTAVLLGTVFLAAVVHLHRERTDTAAKRAFVASNTYLGILLLAVVVDTMAV